VRGDGCSEKQKKLLAKAASDSLYSLLKTPSNSRLPRTALQRGR
jgi:hypothetical protein